MRRFALSLFATALVTAAALPAAAQQASANLAVAAKGGWWHADVTGIDGGPAFGLEISADDNVVLVPPVGRVRHMWSWNHADHDGLALDSVEWNAHWTVENWPGVWVGAGPGIGWVWADGQNLSDALGLQIGVSAHTFVGHALLGIESRYQWTEAGSADNWLTMVKVGYRF